MHTEENNGLANWPDLSKAILRVTEPRYQRYRQWIEKSILEANGVGVGDSKKASQPDGSGTFVYQEEHERRAVGAAQLGVPVPQA
jgi:hypothetical protein